MAACDLTQQLRARPAGVPPRNEHPPEERPLRLSALPHRGAEVPRLEHLPLSVPQLDKPAAFLNRETNRDANLAV